MDVRFDLNGTTFIWNRDKARQNAAKHDGIRFEQAAEAFFDPFLRIEEASRKGEERGAVIGYDSLGRLLYVVHAEIQEEAIRIISARKATREEHERYDF